VPVTVPVHRIGRCPNPWEYPDWSRANPDGTFGNRFDDPEGRYRVLYTSSTRHGCFVETLARYRPDLELYAELKEIEGENDFTPPGIVPREWLEKRCIGSADAHGNFADVAASGWIETLRRNLAPFLIALGIPDFDASVLQRSGPSNLPARDSRRSGSAYSIDPLPSCARLGSGALSARVESRRLCRCSRRRRSSPLAGAYPLRDSK